MPSEPEEKEESQVEEKTDSIILAEEIKKPAMEEKLDSTIPEEKIEESTAEEKMDSTILAEEVKKPTTEEEFDSTIPEKEIEESTSEEKIAPIVAVEDMKKPTTEEIITNELEKESKKPFLMEERPEMVVAQKQEKSVKLTEPESIHKEKSPVPYLVAVIIIVLFLCGGALFFIYYPDLFSTSPEQEVIDMPVTTQPVNQQPVSLDTITPKDTIAEVVPGIKKEVPIEKQPLVPAVNKEPKPTEVKETKKISASPTPVNVDSATYIITGTKATHTIKEGETLTKVALRYYGTKALWPYIVKHNRDVIKNPDNVPYGTTIKIPELTKK